MNAKELMELLTLINEYIYLERVSISCQDGYDWDILIDNEYSLCWFDKDKCKFEEFLKDLKEVLTKIQ